MKHLLSAVLILFAVSAQASSLISLKDFLKKELSGSKKTSKESFSMNESQLKEMKALATNAQDESFTFYYGKSAEGKLERACIVVPQQGKEGPLTIGTCFDAVGLVESVTVLSSEEVRGKKITEESFLSQFKGKKISDAFQVGQDVNGISGATWSSNSVSEAIRKSSYAFKTFVGGKK